MCLFNGCSAFTLGGIIAHVSVFVRIGSIDSSCLRIALCIVFSFPISPLGSAQLTMPWNQYLEYDVCGQGDVFHFFLEGPNAADVFIGDYFASLFERQQLFGLGSENLLLRSQKRIRRG